MKPRPFTASSKWLSALVALLVALGAQVLLQSVLPASVADLPFGSSTRSYRISGESLWVSESVIRFLAFAMGGVVGVLLTRGLSRGFLALLLGVGILATVFAQFSGHAVLLPLVLWSLAAPAGVIVGAWAANARRTGA